MLEGKKPFIFLCFESQRQITGSIGLVIRLLSQLMPIRDSGYCQRPKVNRRLTLTLAASDLIGLDWSGFDPQIHFNVNGR